MERLKSRLLPLLRKYSVNCDTSRISPPMSRMLDFQGFPSSPLKNFTAQYRLSAGGKRTTKCRQFDDASIQRKKLPDKSFLAIHSAHSDVSSTEIPTRTISPLSMLELKDIFLI